MPKTIFRQIDELFNMCKSFKRRRKGVPKYLITSATTFNVYRDACMRFAKDLAERRGTKKFQIVSITPKEVQNFLERVKIVYRPETAHQYASALQKLQHMVNKKYCKKGREINWKIEEFNRPRRTREDVTVQRGPAYTEEEERTANNLSIAEQHLENCKNYIAAAREIIQKAGSEYPELPACVRRNWYFLFQRADIRANQAAAALELARVRAQIPISEIMREIEIMKEIMNDPTTVDIEDLKTIIEDLKTMAEDFKTIAKAWRRFYAVQSKSLEELKALFEQQFGSAPGDQCPDLKKELKEEIAHVEKIVIDWRNKLELLENKLAKLENELAKLENELVNKGISIE